MYTTIYCTFVYNHCSARSETTTKQNIKTKKIINLNPIPSKYSAPPLMWGETKEIKLALNPTSSIT